ncbi:MAG: PQQ-binding-like beta-propeller repeat protein [Vicinamibacterales bacterium]
MSASRAGALVAMSAVLTVLAAGAVSSGRTQAPADTAVRMVVDEGEAARYWARWRGPSGQGIATGTGYPDRWSASENIRWRVDVPGTGNSSPIVWRDRVYLTTARDRGRHVSLLGYHRADGSLAWESAAPSGAADRAHGKNGFATATPPTAGVRSYTRTGAGAGLPT